MIEGQIGVNDFVMNAYSIYGKHIMGSGFQKGRMFCDIYDGLKISYRHYLQVIWEEPNKMTKTQAVIGNALRKYHFTGDASGTGVVYSLVNDYKCVDAQGNTGVRSFVINANGASPRYTEVMLKPQIREQFDRLMPYVPEEVTITGFMEKRYIPTAIPLGLIAGTGIGMGIGYTNNLPAFTANSILEAYREQNPYKLRFNYGYSMNRIFSDDIWYDCKNNTPIKQDNYGNWKICKGHEYDEPSEYNKEQLENAWIGEKCKFEFYIPLYYTNLNGRIGLVAVCDPNITCIGKSFTITEWEKAGYLEVFDISDDIGKMFFGITQGTRKLRYEDIINELFNNCGIVQKQTFHINISTGIITGRVGLYQWIDFTYKNYSNLYSKYIHGELEKLDYQEAIWTNFDFVADNLIKYTIEEKSDQQICDDCNADKNLSKIHKQNPKLICTLDIVHDIGRKPMNTLRTADSKTQLDKIKEKQDYFHNINIYDEITKFVNCWNDL